jgi:predicted glutamine amidotransferase
MCRLFGMTGGREPVRATFWLLEASDSLREQSRRNPDGTGLGWFDADGTPRIDKQPMAGYDDADFATAARDVAAQTFVAHVRYASSGGVTAANTHPFAQRGRLFAHNGALESIDAIEARLEPDVRDLIAGETDSERLFALITSEIERAGGDVGAGIASAVRWLAAEAEIYAINFVLIGPEDLWALRYPEPNELYVLERGPGGVDHHSDARRIAVESPGAGACVVVASEPMDDDEGWRLLEPGELVHVDADLRVRREWIVDGPPAHQLTIADLTAQAKSSQQQG